MESIIERRSGTFDHSAYPLIKIKHTPIDPTIEDIDEFFDTQEQIFNMYSGQFAVAVDCADVSLISMRERKHHVKRLAQMEAKFSDRLEAICLSVPTITSRLMFRSANLLHKPTVPHYIAKTMDEAETIAQRVIEQALAGRSAESAAS